MRSDTDHIQWERRSSQFQTWHARLIEQSKNRKRASNWNPPNSWEDEREINQLSKQRKKVWESARMIASPCKQSKLTTKALDIDRSPIDRSNRKHQSNHGSNLSTELTRNTHLKASCHCSSHYPPKPNNLQQRSIVIVNTPNNYCQRPPPPFQLSTDARGSCDLWILIRSTIKVYSDFLSGH